MSGIIINYPPHLIDEAIKEHIAKHMNVTGDVEIDYTHRRKTRTVSAEVTISTQQIGSVKESEPSYEEELKDKVVSISEKDCTSLVDPEPVSEDSNDSMFGNLPDQEPSDESEDLFG